MATKTLENITISIAPEQIIASLKKMKREDRESFIEDMLAAICPEYLESIREARRDYKEGRVYSHDEVFG